MGSSTPTMIRAASFYARCGYSVLAWRYTDGQKRPAHKWAHLQDIAQTAGEVSRWWQDHPLDNVGIITGKVSNLVVVDCDDDAAIAWVLANLPATPWHVQTGRGQQFGYRHPGGKIGNRVKIGGIALDLRGDGGYVSAPPSIHKNGQIYRWLGRPWEAAEIPTFDPAWLPLPPPVIAPPPAPLGLSNDARLRGAMTWIARREPAIEGQGGQAYTCKTAFRIATLGISYPDALELFRRWNGTCAPPWSDSELTAFLTSAWNKAT